MLIDRELKELQDTWDFTIEELKHIKEVMANYALAALMDSSVRKEAEEICQEQWEEDVTCTKKK